MRLSQISSSQPFKLTTPLKKDVGVHTSSPPGTMMFHLQHPESAKIKEKDVFVHVADQYSRAHTL